MKKLSKPRKAASREFEPGPKEAAHVAWMLRVDPALPFPHGPESNEEADCHLVEWVLIELARLSEEAKPVTEKTPEFMEYWRTLGYCNAIMSGVIKVPSQPWDMSTSKCRRGTYHPKGAWSGDGQ